MQENILNDLVFPSEISGKRTRVKTDGSKLLKVYLQDKFNADKVARFPGHVTSCFAD